MEQTLEKFKSHLFKVCEDDCLRKLALDFYEDFSKFYKGQVFVRENFETIEIDGEIYEQDIVKDLFADKDEVTAEEIFTYNFINFVEKLEFFEKQNHVAGVVNAIKKRILLYKPNSKQFFNYIVDKTKDTPPLFSIFSESNLIKGVELSKNQIAEYKAIAKKYDIDMEAQIQALRKNPEKIIKETFYHEFCHLFEVRKFKNGKYLKNNMSSRIVELKNKRRKKCMSGVTSIDENLKVKEKFIKDNACLIGSNALSEILNEELNQNVLRRFSTKDVSGLYQSTASKKQMNSGSTYRINYDFATLFKCVIFDEDMKNLRFNASHMIKCFNQFQISEELLSKCIEDIKTNLININYDIYFRVQNVLDNLKSGKNTSFEIINILSGVFENAKNMDDTFVFYTKLSPYLIEFKENIQALYMDVIKSSVIQKLNDDQFVKDDEFYKQLNQTLENIDNFLIYPVENIEENYFDENGKKERKNHSSLNLYSLDKCVEKFKNKLENHKQIKIFHELFHLIKQHVENLPDEERERVLSHLTFFEKQDSIDKKYFALQVSLTFDEIYNERTFHLSRQTNRQLDDSEKDLF